MTDNDLKLDTDELRQIVSEEIEKVVTNMVSKDELHQALSSYSSIYTVQALVEQEVKAAANEIITSAVNEMQATVQNLIQTMSDRFANLETLIATLAEQQRNQNDWVQSVRRDQERLDNENAQTLARLDKQNERTIKVESEHHELRRDIFGGNGNGPKSLVEEQRNNFKNLELMITNNQAALMGRVTRIEIDVAKQNEWIEARQRLERMAIKYIGGLFKGAGGLLKSKVFWALLLGGGSIGTALWWLLENLL
jgi:hypothetical protein